MQVNLRAVSEALDGLLAEKPQNQQTFRPWQNSAIIQKRQKPTSEPAISSTQLTELNRTTTTTSASVRTESLTQNQHHNLIENSRALQSSESTKNTAILTTTPYLTQLKSIEKNKTTASLSKSDITPHTSPSHKRNSSGNSASRLRESEDRSDVQALFEVLQNADPIAVRPVESSGIGVGSILVTPQNIAKRVEKAQLSSKSWVTNTSLSASASVTLEIENFQQIKEKQCRFVPSGRQPVEQSRAGNGALMRRNVQILLYVDAPEENRQRHQTSQNELHFTASVEISSSRRRAFHTICTEEATNRRIVSLSISGTLLEQFIRLTVTPNFDTYPVKIIRVRALAVLWSDTWTAEEVVQAIPPNTLEAEVEETLRELSEERGKSDSSTKIGSSSDTLATPIPRLSSPDEKYFAESDVKNHRLASEPKDEADDAEVNSSVANFVKGIALKSLDRSDDHATQLAGSPAKQSTTWEYNWLNDQLQPAAAGNADLFVTVSHQEAGGSEARVTPSATAALSEYLATLQAWNSVASWTFTDAVKFCMSQTTSFSAGSVFSSELCDASAAVHLTQPFKVHFLVVVNASERRRDKSPPFSIGSAPPPLQSLSALASQASSLGFATELLFKTDVADTFGCLLRPENTAYHTTEERCKLLFVVPAHEQPSRRGDAANVLLSVLQTTLGVYEHSIKVLKSLQQRYPASNQIHSSLGVLRMLIDGTESFDKLVPVFSEWCALAGSIRYYGSASQTLLQLLLAPTLFAGLTEASSNSWTQETCRIGAQWCKLSLRLLATWKDGSAAVGEAGPCTVALELQAKNSDCYVWQPVSRDRSSVRLLLTDTHLLESSSVVDGFLLPPASSEFAKHFFASFDSGVESTPPIATFSEAPWSEFLTEAENVFGAKEAAADASPKNNAFTVLASLRRQLSISFAFQILSTAFKRGWESVAVGLPLSCAQLHIITAAFSRKRGFLPQHYETNLSALDSSFSFFDQDAFIDTFAQWSYAFPRLVILHCTSIFHPFSMSSTAAIDTSSTSSDVNSQCGFGVSSLFSPDTLYRGLGLFQAHF